MLLNKFLMIFMGFGYIFLLIGYGQKGINARKEQGKTTVDALASMGLTVAVVFWIVRLVMWLRNDAPGTMDSVLVFGLPALYVLWCIAARRSVKRGARKAGKQTASAKQTVSTASGMTRASGNAVSAAGSGNNTFNKGGFDKFDSSGSAAGNGGFTITHNGAQGGGNNGGTVNFGTAGNFGASGGFGVSGMAGNAGTAQDKPETPLDRNMGLGGHHVSAANAHLGMSVSYVVQDHTVRYTFWSDKDPEKTEVFQIPEHIRTKEALINYLIHSTSIPSVCFEHW